MDDRRLLLAIALAGLILFGWQFFLSKSGLVPSQPSATRTTTATSPGNTPSSGPLPAPQPVVPAGSSTPPLPFTPARTHQPVSLTASPESLTVVDTDLWKMVLSNRGARPIHWVLKGYRRGDGRPLDLASPDGSLEALVLRRQGTQIDFSTAVFQVVEDRMQDSIRVISYWAQDSLGATLTVHYRIPQSGNVVGVSYEVPQAGPDDKILTQWRSWKFDTETNESEDLRQARVACLLGEELAQDHLSAFKKTPEKARTGNVQWAVLRSKYFALGFLFPQDAMSGVTTLGYPDSLRLGVRFENALLSRKSVGYEMYVGPVDFWKLQSVGHNLTRLVDSGFKPMVPLNRLVLKFFTLTHKVVPNYGLVIIVLSVLMRLAFWPLSQSQMRSMQKMQELQPEMERIRQKYKNDQEKLNKEVLRLYKENSVNPFGGCLPILAQMPVFIALYNVLSISIELRQAGFLGWINDLSAPDVIMTLGPAAGGFPLHVLPLIMAATMFWQQKLTPMDPRQATTGYIMPFVMLFIFYKMPSGLVLYWTVTNILTALQQMRLRAARPATVTS